MNWNTNFKVGVHFDLETKKSKLDEMEKLTIKPDFWEIDKAKRVLQEAAALKMI